MVVDLSSSEAMKAEYRGYPGRNLFHGRVLLETASAGPGLIGVSSGRGCSPPRGSLTDSMSGGANKVIAGLIFSSAFTVGRHGIWPWTSGTVCDVKEMDCQEPAHRRLLLRCVKLSKAAAVSATQFAHELVTYHFDVLVLRAAVITIAAALCSKSHRYNRSTTISLGLLHTALQLDLSS